MSKINIDALARKIVNAVSVQHINTSNQVGDMEIKLKSVCDTIQLAKNKVTRIIHNNAFGTHPNNMARQSHQIIEYQESLVKNMRYYFHRNSVLQASTDQNSKDSFARNRNAFLEIYGKVKADVTKISVILSHYL